MTRLSGIHPRLAESHPQAWEGCFSCGDRGGLSKTVALQQGPKRGSQETIRKGLPRRARARRTPCTEEEPVSQEAAR